MVFVHHDDIAALGFDNGDLVDLISEWDDGIERTAPAFRIVEYDTPRGCAAAYFPEANPLIPLDSTARGSNCPTSKSVIVRLEPATRKAATHSDQGTQAGVGADREHKSRVQPKHLS